MKWNELSKEEKERRKKIGSKKNPLKQKRKEYSELKTEKEKINYIAKHLGLA